MSLTRYRCHSPGTDITHHLHSSPTGYRHHPLDVSTTHQIQDHSPDTDVQIQASPTGHRHHPPDIGINNKIQASPTRYSHCPLDTGTTHQIQSSPTGYRRHPPSTGSTRLVQAPPVPFLSVANSWLPRNCQHWFPKLSRTPPSQCTRAHQHPGTSPNPSYRWDPDAN